MNITELLIPNWKTVLKKSLSVSFAAASAALGLIQLNFDLVLEALPLMEDYVKPSTFGLLSTLAAFLSIAGRVKRQKSISGEL